jgi:DNA-binding transcriptional regulator YiaG
VGDDGQIPPDFGARIRAARAYCGLSQDDLAEALHQSPGWLKPREAGDKIPTHARSDLRSVSAHTRAKRSQGIKARQISRRACTVELAAERDRLIRQAP